MKKLLNKINPFQNTYEPFMAAIAIACLVVLVLVLISVAGK